MTPFILSMVSCVCVPRNRRRARGEVYHEARRWTIKDFVKAIANLDRMWPQADVPVRHKRALPNGLRWLVRVFIWIAVFITVCVGLFVNWVFSVAPYAYADIHDTKTWVPLSYLTPEARDYSDWAWGGARSVEVILYPVTARKDLAARFCLMLSLDENVGQELAMNHSFYFPQPKRPVELELLFAHSYSHREKRRYVEELAEQGRLDMFEYSRLLKLARHGTDVRYPGRPTWD